MTPPEVYIAVFRLSNGKTMPMLSSSATYIRWFSHRDEYADKRIKRFNSRKAGRLSPAVAFTMQRYVRAE